VLLLGFVGLVVRLIFVQIVDHEYYARLAADQQILKQPIKARRGGFFDRMGRPICVSVPARSVFVAPAEIELDDVPKVSQELSRVLNVDETELRNAILGRYDGKEFKWVKRRVSDYEAAAAAALHLKGVKFRAEYRRTFPQGVLVPHVIGWVNVDQEGQEGLERTLDKELTGKDGLETLECDGSRRPLLTERAKFEPVVHGSDVQLTVDVEIQRIVEDELSRAMDEWNPLSVTIIVMEVKTGRVLALGNAPSFSPLRPGNCDPADRLNRAVCACYEPGSIFKPFVMAGFLDAKLGQLDDTIFCENGLFRIRGRRLHDHHPYGWLTVSEVIEKSSNVGMAKIGLQMGAGRLFGTITAFGFGQSTESGLPGELEGIVTPFRKWSVYTVTSVPMGQEIAATPMQIITAFNTIANDGVLVKPQVVETITDADGKVLYKFEGPEAARRVIRSETARLLIDPALRGVIVRGTGKAANFGTYPKFGKTGTAQKVATSGGFAHSRFVSSFLCGAPVDDPKVTALVLIDEPRRGQSYYGGTVAAPAAARIVEKTLKYLRAPAMTVARGADL
jgi:cell division protein FtsI/penicillin-binding protein 2